MIAEGVKAIHRWSRYPPYRQVIDHVHLVGHNDSRSSLIYNNRAGQIIDLRNALIEASGRDVLSYLRERDRQRRW